MKRPNILFLYTDQQRWDTIRANGNSVIKTPNLDRLAAGGTNFDCCISQNPVCMPSRISAMTGQYCSALKITHMAVTVPEETQTIQKILAGYGYYNGLIGKLHYLAHSNRDHRKLHPTYDFHHMELSDEPGCYDDAYRAWAKRKAPDQMDHISLGLPPAVHNWRGGVPYTDTITHPDRRKGGLLARRAIPFAGRSDLTQAAFVGEQTMEFIRTHKDRPFFCFSGFYSPHSPWVAPQEFIDLYKDTEIPLPEFPEEMEAKRAEAGCTEEELKSVVTGYYAMISEVDSWIGRILDTLEEEGLADDTIIVFTSDHGEWLGEHLRFGKGHWAPDVVSRVPLIIRVPEALGGASGRTVHEIVECVDIVPTLLDTAGYQVPPEVQGDILPVTASNNVMPGDGLGLTEHTGWKSLRFENYRYVAEADGTERLFDLTADPMEYRDVSGETEYGEALQRARRLLIGRMLRVEQPLEKEWAY